MQVRLLGPVDVIVDGRCCEITGARRKALLAALALHAGDVVSTGRLTEAVWGAWPPASAAQTLHSHVSHLRRLLGGGDAIRSVPPGYRLELPDDGTDVQVAQRLIRQGTAAVDPGTGARLLREAIALWRGRPMAELSDLGWFDDQIHYLDSLYAQATRALTQHRLALGEHAGLVPELELLAADHPLDEDLHRQLMLALYRDGRHADALEVHRELRQALREEGLDPSPALQDLERAILRHDVEALAGAAPAGETPLGRQATPAAAEPGADPPVPWPAPAQLPASVAGFTGRDHELSWLDDALAEATAVVISAVSGTAGVGKTALAVTWAHRASGRFPGGQLYVNLRGFDPGLPPVDPAAALRGFLVALGHPAGQIPLDAADQIGLYRSLLTGRRVLVVLDNARDAEQVRPLLPGAPGCLAVVTSRNQLTPLAVAEGARTIQLDLPDRKTCRQLLISRIGPDRVAAESDAVDEIIERCSRLPLALAIAGARAHTESGLPLADFAAELRGGTVLRTLAAGDTGSDVRSVFSCSLRALPPAAQRMFVLLGLHHGPDLTVAAAAALAGMPREESRRCLSELTRVNLLSQHSTGRYTFHDLLRAYAAEQADDQLTAADRQAAIRRMLDHYGHTAQACARVAFGSWDHVKLPPPEPGTVVERPASVADATAWLDAERAVVLAVIERAAATWTAQVWRLAYSLGTYLGRNGYWREWETALRDTLRAAEIAGDKPGQAHSHHGLGMVLADLGQYEAAEDHLRQALTLFTALGLAERAAQAHLALGYVFDCRNEDRAAFREGRLALVGYRHLQHLPGQAVALNNIGWSLAKLGRPGLGIGPCRQSLELNQSTGDVQGQAGAWDSLGYIHGLLGNLDESIACYDRAAQLYQAVSGRRDEAGSLQRLGDAYHAAGRLAEAVGAWQRALTLYERLNHPEAAAIRRLLGHPSPG